MVEVNAVNYDTSDKSKLGDKTMAIATKLKSLEYSCYSLGAVTDAVVCMKEGKIVICANGKTARVESETYNKDTWCRCYIYEYFIRIEIDNIKNEVTDICSIYIDKDCNIIEGTRAYRETENYVYRQTKYSAELTDKRTGVTQVFESKNSDLSSPYIMVGYCRTVGKDKIFMHGLCVDFKREKAIEYLHAFLVDGLIIISDVIKDLYNCRSEMYVSPDGDWKDIWSYNSYVIDIEKDKIYIAKHEINIDNMKEGIVFVSIYDDEKCVWYEKRIEHSTIYDLDYDTIETDVLDKYDIENEGIEVKSVIHMNM